MIGVVLLSHGPAAQALLDSAELILGEQGQACALGLRSEDGPESFRQSLREAITHVDTGEGVLIMVDMFGGTPANTVAAALREEPFHCLCGMNLAMLLEALLSRDMMPLPELAKYVLRKGRASVCDLGLALARHRGHETN